jgi:primosomal protein N' (replication factor Y)
MINHSTKIVQVALPTPLRRRFDYALPDGMHPEPGMRLRVPFGGRELIGIVLGMTDETDVPAEKLKPALELLDEKPILNEQDLVFAEFAARYYHHSIGDVLSHMLPVALRHGKPALIKTPRKKKSVDESIPDSSQILNTEQAVACEHIENRFHQYSVTLLQGVTGSGKTEVYLQLIDKVLKQGKQILVLVPEIGLTPQTLSRIQARFSTTIGLLHSNIAQGARLQTWLKAQQGDISILIGTRSAVFTPMPNLGLIVIDEEHDLSFKQQDGFRYSARDLAIWRAHQMNIPVVLGSATPSLETLHNVHQQKYYLETLTQRVLDAKPPLVKLIDLKNQNLEGGLSGTLIKAIENTLAKNEQVLLFLNRRGYAPTWMCHTCGWVADCPRCDARLTYHQNGRLICHHCDYQIKRLSRCKSCGSESNILVGEGTQRLEEVLQKRFPKASIARIDRDSTRKKQALSEMINKINQREFNILLGTQMLAKGHHFPYVTLVAIIDADSGLLSADFRASERMAQLLTQVSGRAGREHLAGEVIVQTHHPEHPLLQQLLTEGYPAFAQSALQERALMALPPHGHLALLRAESVQALSPMQFLQQVREFLAPLNQIRCMGPIPATMEKRQGKFRAQLLICGAQRANLQHALLQLVQALEGALAPKRVRWSLDVDPQEMS